MKLYLFSPINCIAQVDSQIIPLTKNNPCVVCGDINSVNFTITEKFENCVAMPKEGYCNNAKIYNFYDGFLIIPKLLAKRNLPYKRISEQTSNYFGNEIYVSLYCDGATKLSISGNYYHTQVELPFLAESFEITPHSSKPILVISVKGKKCAILAFSLPNLNCLLKVVCDKVEFSDYVTLTTYHSDLAKHVVMDIWKVGNPFELSARKISSGKSNFKEELIPLAFLQEIAILGDYQNFLNEELRKRASLIPDFIGKFSNIILPIKNGYPNTYSLVQEDEIKFFDAKVENGLIVDVNIN